MHHAEYGIKSAEASVSPSVFRAFDFTVFIEWSTWRRLQSILATNGGAYGIAGPRGSGKTWLMLSGVARAKALDGLGLWFPSPSNYSAVEFLTALSENFAAEVQRIATNGSPRWYDRVASIPLFLASLALVIAAAYSLTSPLDPISPLVAGSGFAAGILLMTAAVMGLRRRGTISVMLFREAAALRERIRYSEARRTSTQATAQLTRASWLGSMMSSKERGLTERTFYLASLVHELRILMSLTARMLHRPIVVAIDELDKIHDPEDARKLLRDIKGIFEVEGVHFLVSVSLEAQRSLDLGSIRGRDEFQSSFYAVIGMETPSPQECHELLQSRTTQPMEKEAAWALGVLGEGNLREVIRLADIALDEERLSLDEPVPPEVHQPLGPEWAVQVVLKSEVEAFRTEILTSSLPEELKSLAHEALPSWDKQPPSPNNLLSCRRQHWTLLELEDERQETYVEPWRRLLVRLAIGGIILSNLDALVRKPQIWFDLQRLTVVAGSSSSTAAILLENFESEHFRQA